MKIEKALKSFEKIFKCRISFHDYHGVFRGKDGLGKYLHHMNPFCDYVKSTGAKNLKSCVAFDAEMLKNRFMENPVPVFKICHAGVMELCIPILNGQKLAGAMFAGPFHPDKKWFGHPDVLFQKNSSIHTGRFEKVASSNLSRLGTNDFSDMLNFALLLASGVEHFLASPSLTMDAYSPERKIALFIDREFASKDVSLEKLASFLNLGASRTSQLLKKHFNKTFPELLLEKRMDCARYLLKETFLKTEDIARTCGFADSSYFFRTFKSHNSGLTPAQYRKKERLFSIDGAGTKI